MLTTDTLGYDFFLLYTKETINETKKSDLIKSITFKGQSSYIKSKLDKETFVKEFKENLPPSIEDPLATEKCTKIH